MIVSRVSLGPTSKLQAALSAINALCIPILLQVVCHWSLVASHVPLTARPYKLAPTNRRFASAMLGITVRTEVLAYCAHGAATRLWLAIPSVSSVLRIHTMTRLMVIYALRLTFVYQSHKTLGAPSVLQDLIALQATNILLML